MHATYFACPDLWTNLQQESIREHYHFAWFLLLQNTTKLKIEVFESLWKNLQSIWNPLFPLKFFRSSFSVGVTRVRKVFSFQLQSRMSNHVFPPNIKDSWLTNSSSLSTSLPFLFVQFTDYKTKKIRIILNTNSLR